VTDFSTSSRILEPIFAREIQTVFVTLLCLTDKLVYVEMAELRYPSHLHHGRASVALECVSEFDGKIRWWKRTFSAGPIP
jgi:hypothetical protein